MATPWTSRIKASMAAYVFPCLQYFTRIPTCTKTDCTPSIVLPFTVRSITRAHTSYVTSYGKLTIYFFIPSLQSGSKGSGPCNTIDNNSFYGNTYNVQSSLGFVPRPLPGRGLGTRTTTSGTVRNGSLTSCVNIITPVTRL